MALSFCIQFEFPDNIIIFVAKNNPAARFNYERIGFATNSSIILNVRDGNPVSSAGEAARVRRARANTSAAINSCFGVIFNDYWVFKERVQAGVANFGLIFSDQPPATSADFKLAA